MRRRSNDLIVSILGEGRYVRTNAAIVAWALASIGIAVSILAGSRLGLEIAGGVLAFVTGFLFGDLT